MFENATLVTYGLTAISAIFIGMVLGYQLRYMGERKSDDIVPAGTKVRFKTKLGHWSYGIVLEDFVEDKNQFIVVRAIEWKMSETSMEAHEGYRVFPIKLKEGVYLLGTGPWVADDYID